MYELNIVEMNEENENEVPQRGHYPFNENIRPQHELKVFDMNQYIRCHDRQIQRLQKDQTKRIEDYRQLRLRLETDTSGLQRQIDDIRMDLQKMFTQSVHVEEVRKRLLECEEQAVHTQIHNDSEFEVLRSVMEKVCGRIDRMEELQRAEREHWIHSQQQGMRNSIIQSPRISTPQHPGYSVHSEQSGHPGQAAHSGQSAHPGQSTHQGQSRLPGQVPDPGKPGHTESCRHPSRFVQPRVECPKCQKILSKSYLSQHLKKQRCKCVQTPYSHG